MRLNLDFVENLEILGLVLSISIRCRAEKWHHLSVLDLVYSMLTDLGYTLLLRDQNDIESFKEADKAQDSMGELHRCRDGVILTAKWVIEIIEKRLFVVRSQVLLDDILQLILVTLSVSFLQDFDDMLFTLGFISASEHEELISLT